MSFASLVFFVFLPTIFCIHWLVPRKAWQNTVLLGASYLFYGWWDWRFCFLILASSLIDYAAGLWIGTEHRGERRKRILVVALSANLLILGFFKYFNFFADSLAIALSLLGLDVPTTTLSIILPVGISFYTFQTMSYTIDIYRGSFVPQRSLLDYLTFVSFFPHLVAGPIMRAAQLLPQFHSVRSFSADAAREGCRMILWGLVKKMLLADNLAQIVHNAYNAPASVTGAELALATICFAFQIYCDFSGFADIAVGTARLFGIELMRNFAYPYFAQNITEFWRRWHISLTSWFRDYVYIPLGGNRVPRAKHYRNLMLTAFLSGLWHGAAWHFLVWGVLHGLFLVSDRALGAGKTRTFARDLVDVPGGKSIIPSAAVLLRMAGTFALVCLAWIFFRASTVGEGLIICGKIVAGATEPSLYATLILLLRRHALVLSFLITFVGIEWLGRRHGNALALGAAPVALRWSAYTALFWIVLLFGTERTQEFIYFRF